ncbi:hypothetical protein [Microbacterium paulum]
MRTITSISTIAALALSLAACSAAAPADTGKTPDTTPAATATPTPSEAASEFGEAVKNSRGNLVKTIGQLAGTSSLTSDVVTSRFAVTDLVLDPTCDSGFPDSPANGHYLGIHLNVESTPELAEEEFPWVSFTQYDWQAYDADGKRLNDPIGNAWTCLDSSQAPPRRSDLGRASPAGSSLMSPRRPAQWCWPWAEAPSDGSGLTDARHHRADDQMRGGRGHRSSRV